MLRPSDTGCVLMVTRSAELHEIERHIDRCIGRSPGPLVEVPLDAIAWRDEDVRAVLSGYRAVGWTVTVPSEPSHNMCVLVPTPGAHAPPIGGTVMFAAGRPAGTWRVLGHEGPRLLLLGGPDGTTYTGALEGEVIPCVTSPPMTGDTFAGHVRLTAGQRAYVASALVEAYVSGWVSTGPMMPPPDRARWHRELLAALLGPLSLEIDPGREDPSPGDRP